MSPQQQERRFDPSYAQTLLDIAEGDFRTAEFTARGFQDGKVRIENVFFLYEQAMEKALTQYMLFESWKALMLLMLDGLDLDDPRG